MTLGLNGGGYVTRRMSDIITGILAGLMFFCALLLFISPINGIRPLVHLARLLSLNRLDDGDLHPGGTEALRLLREEPQPYLSRYGRIVQFYRLCAVCLFISLLVVLWILY